MRPLGVAPEFVYTFPEDRGDHDEATRNPATSRWCVFGCAAWSARAATEQNEAHLAPAGKAAEIGTDPNGLAFIDELKRLGYAEGTNLTVERYSGEGNTSRYDDLVREVVSANPDLIYCLGVVLAKKFKAATSTIPIVTLTGDPIRQGLLTSIARPGGNVTGVSVDAGFEIWGKRLELLLDALPKISRVAFVSSPGAFGNAGGRSVQEVAQNRGVLLRNAAVENERNEAEYRRVLDSIQSDQFDGIAFAEETEAYPFRILLTRLVEQAHIPAIYPYREQTEAGGLMSYSYDLKGVLRTNARQVADILNGARPGELPYEQASRFELVINLKTAKSLGLEISPALLARADKVIE